MLIMKAPCMQAIPLYTHTKQQKKSINIMMVGSYDQ